MFNYIRVYNIHHDVLFKFLKSCVKKDLQFYRFNLSFLNIFFLCQYIYTYSSDELLIFIRSYKKMKMPLIIIRDLENYLVFISIIVKREKDNIYI